MAGVKMNRSQVKAVVISVLEEVLRPDPARLTEDASIVHDLHADSLDVVELGLLFEDRLSLPVELDLVAPVLDIHTVLTVGDLINFLERKVNGN